MRRSLLVLSLFAFVAVVLAQQTGELGKKPITTAKSKVGDLLRKWDAEGTAAGNVGDWYDNRDGGHSDLNTAPYPQLQRVEYSEEDKNARRHWAAARIVRPEVTFGNSSTSAPPKEGGSNPRSYYSFAAGLQLLHQQYVRNNIYIYPEHRDHDPGHNGPSEGFGDLYPTNTPYLFISQGSSGSDQPFMRAIPHVLAAFRPDVKKKLVETGLLMPTVQMLFRRHSKRLKGPEEYFTYKAHPTVFEGSWVDDLALVQAAHDITLESIPPMVELKVVAEDEFQIGRDYFDPLSEKLGDTPCVIARIWRSAAGTRRMTVSAEASFDVNKRPLSYRWVILRGEADKIKIEPKNKEGSVVELTVPYHERRPIFPGAELESNRVDIGVFVDNGANPSAPGFVTFCSLDSESRTYDEKGRIREIGYGAGEVVYTVTDGMKWIAAVQDPEIAGLLRLTEEERKQIADVGPKLEGLEASLKAARDEQKEAESRRQKAVEAAKKDPALEPERKKADADAQAAQKVTQAKTKSRDDFLDGKGEPISLRKVAGKHVRDAARADDFLKRLAETKRWAETSAGAKKAIETARDPASDPTTEFGRVQLERQQSLALARVLFPGSLSAEFRVNYVDRRLTVPKFWRDVYRYDADGGLAGWTRHDGKTATEYSPQGLIVEEKDARGRCTLGRIVDYRAIAGKAPATGRMVPLPSNTVVTLRYADERDRVGTVEKKEERAK